MFCSGPNGLPLAGGPLTTATLVLPTRLVIKPGIGFAPFGPFGLTRPPAFVTVLPSELTKLPTSAPSGFFVVAPTCVPAELTAPPICASRPPTGAPRPVCVPTVCVTSPAVCTIGVMAVLSGWVICCTGTEASVLPSVAPPAFSAPAVVESTPANGVVSGDSGARLPVPRPPTVVLRPCTTPLVELTTEPSPATVVPTGLEVTPICPTPSLTALASEFSVVLVLETALPRPCVTCGLRPGMVCEAIVLPRSLVVFAAAVATPLVLDVEVVGGPPLVVPPPPALPLPDALDGTVTPLPPHAASKPATATTINGARNDDTVAHAAWREKKRWVDMCAPQCLSVFWMSCALFPCAGVTGV
ncbi:hypothetical protein OI25_3983 [Paraburkholderia fungorum]|uniref:Uncharacterized protein n=1 Tax=Paraburkholderia fungorum TaxID=134537 RepID=A0AAU8SYD1_9BURK|nr:hypothetical protein OI25_3983 [Paraburkholderia fungorum]